MRYRFKISLRGVDKPYVWRKIEVPADISFATFHAIIQFVFQWYDMHPWQFSPRGYGSAPQIASGDPMNDYEFSAEKTKVSDMFRRKFDRMVYIYDFEDDWTHDIVLEEITPDDRSDSFTLIGAKGATPPENCGGVVGFEHFKEVMCNPKHEEYATMCEWLGIFPDEEHWDSKNTEVDKGDYIMSKVFSQ